MRPLKISRCGNNTNKTAVPKHFLITLGSVFICRETETEEAWLIQHKSQTHQLQSKTGKLSYFMLKTKGKCWNCI